MDTLKNTLRDNLHSCVLYGSAVRGNIVPDVSDLNLLIVLAESTPEAHQVIAEAIRGKVQIEPFVLGREGLERDRQAFAIKFRSIRRNYRVLHGADPLPNLSVSEELLRFLSEQAVRNLRLRLNHAFITMQQQPKRYSRYLHDAVPDLFTDLAEALRCVGTEIPADFSERIPIFAHSFGGDASVLNDLLERKRRSRNLSATEIRDVHDKLSRLMTQAVRWIESQWPPLSQPKPR